MSFSYAKYSKKRDEQSKLNETQTDLIICQHFNITPDQLVNTDGTQSDFQGIDRILPTNETIQKKNIKYMGFNTITIPCVNYDQYKEHKIDLLFHSYYNPEDPTNVRQWVLIKLSDLVQFHDNEKKIRRNGSTTTDFYYWNYNKDDTENSILKHALAYSIP